MRRMLAECPDLDLVVVELAVAQHIPVEAVDVVQLGLGVSDAADGIVPVVIAVGTRSVDVNRHTIRDRYDMKERQRAGRLWGRGGVAELGKYNLSEEKAADPTEDID